jgi:hypothetical protein
MIAIKPFAQQIELSFWTTVIPLMSESRLVQKTFVKTVQITNSVKKIYTRKPVYFLSAIGFGLGVFLGLISVIFVPAF